MRKDELGLLTEILKILVSIDQKLDSLSESVREEIKPDTVRGQVKQWTRTFQQPPE